MAHSSINDQMESIELNYFKRSHLIESLMIFPINYSPLLKTINDIKLICGNKKSSNHTKSHHLFHVIIAHMPHAAISELHPIDPSSAQQL